MRLSADRLDAAGEMSFSTRTFQAARRVRDGKPSAALATDLLAAQSGGPR
jgi:hypothetical protein